jgi:hypothetical protein
MQPRRIPTFHATNLSLLLLILSVTLSVAQADGRKTSLGNAPAAEQKPAAKTTERPGRLLRTA